MFGFRPKSAKPAKLVVGLGNPGDKYARTRHNAGWMALDKLADATDAGNWRDSSRFQGLHARAGDTIYLKPTTMMNLSGRAVRKVMDWYRLSIADVTVIHDDADLPLGEIRLQPNTQTGAGHHGVLSVIEHIGPGFRRIRVGIGRPDQPSRDIGNFVLSPLSEPEMQKLEASFNKLSDLL